jgi:two-component system LytT family response regulator
VITPIHSTHSPAKYGAMGPTLRLGSGKLARFLSVSMIVHVEGNGNYSWLYTRNGDRYLISKTIRALNSQLPGFWRVHKSRLVNPDYVLGSIASVRNKAILRLSTSETVVVARRYKKNVCDCLKWPPIES